MALEIDLGASLVSLPLPNWQATHKESSELKTLMTRFHGGSSRSDFAYLLKLIKINNGFWSTETPDGEIIIPPGHMITVEVDDRGNVAVFRVTKDD